MKPELTLNTLGNTTRRFGRLLARLYYSSMWVTGRERLPLGGPVLFVANHPNSLLDAALVGLTAQRPVHFMAKAPLFDVPLFGALMRALGMIPVYRGRDEPGQVDRNFESLEIAAQWLVKGEVVGIFPEGKTHDLTHVEQVRTGAARIALRATNQNAPALIVPLGLNYECKDQFRSAAWVRVGQSIDASAVLREHEGDERKAMRALTREIDLGLKSVVVHLEDERWTSILPELEVLLPPVPEFANVPAAPLCQRKRIADAINYFLTADRPRAEAIATSIEQHRATLAAEGLVIRSAVMRWRGRRLFFWMLGHWAWLTLTFVPALVGMLHHLVPFVLTRVLVNRFKYPGRATIALNRILIGLPIYALWYALVWWALARWTTPWIATVWTIAMPLVGVRALWFARTAGETVPAALRQLLILFRPRRLHELRQQQLDLQHQLRLMADEYAKVSPRAASFV